MKKATLAAAWFFVLMFGVAVTSAQCDSLGSSLDSGDLDGGNEEMEQMDQQMETQPDDGLRMDVQANDAIDSEGTGAH